MNVFDWLLIAWFVLATVSTVSMVGKPREPVDSRLATWAVIISAVLILFVVLGAS